MRLILATIGFFIVLFSEISEDPWLDLAVGAVFMLTAALWRGDRDAR